MSDASKLASFLNAQIRELTDRRDAAICEAVAEGESSHAIGAVVGLAHTTVLRIVERANGG